MAGHALSELDPAQDLCKGPALIEAGAEAEVEVWAADGENSSASISISRNL